MNLVLQLARQILEEAVRGFVDDDDPTGRVRLILRTNDADDFRTFGFTQRATQ